MPAPYQHTYEFEVRDYECDLQGIVNNANYQHYLEHARHKFLTASNIDFAALSQRGVNLVVVRIEIDYLFPLRSNDRFVVASNVIPVSRVRFGILQDVLRLPDHKPIANAKVIGATMDAVGRAIRPPADLAVLFPK